MEAKILKNSAKNLNILIAQLEKEYQANGYDVQGNRTTKNKDNKFNLL